MEWLTIGQSREFGCASPLALRGLHGCMGSWFEYSGNTVSFGRSESAEQVSMLLAMAELSTNQEYGIGGDAGLQRTRKTWAHTLRVRQPSH